ncbi:hypothetical protein OESDEN_18019 [Oesophagostomum dentatum]|uniref:Uncharacterized protein n=1 Tax=Oesophagostomum dentatum TaxID=61180 RepID=A0A0B1SBI7_OESDE|nr:hypothetical protein OESDEN_18019 [Oesophagostomum dentatum]
MYLCVRAGPLDNEGASGAYDADDNFEDIKGMSYAFPTTSGEAQPTARKRSRLSDSPGDTADDSDEESSISDFFLNGDQNENDTDLADKLEAAYRLNKKLLTQAFETASGLMEGKRLDLLDQLNRELKFVLECFPTTH